MVWASEPTLCLVLAVRAALICQQRLFVTLAKRPASPLTAKPLNSPSRAGEALGSRPGGKSTEDTREELDDVQRQIIDTTDDLDRRLRKNHAKRTKAEHTRIANLQMILVRLQDVKRVLSNSLPTLPPSPKKTRPRGKSILDNKVDSENMMDWKMEEPTLTLDRTQRPAISAPVRRGAKSSVYAPVPRVKQEPIDVDDIFSVQPKSTTMKTFKPPALPASRMQDVKPKIEPKVEPKIEPKLQGCD